MPYKIVLEKENFKFSGSHFTIFSAGSGERLHGHNYYVSVEISLSRTDSSRGLAFDFNEVKPMVRAITGELDEFVLLPARSPHLKITREGAQVQVRFSEKLYSFPASDVRVLPVVNVTAEELSRLIAEDLISRLKATIEEANAISKVAVGVQETRGQSVYFETEFA